MEALAVAVTMGDNEGELGNDNEQNSNLIAGAEEDDEAPPGEQRKSHRRERRRGARAGGGEYGASHRARHARAAQASKRAGAVSPLHRRLAILKMFFRRRSTVVEASLLQEI